MTTPARNLTSIMSKDYGSWSLADLKRELKKRNAKVTGKKSVLVQRLGDYDKLFGPLINDPESVFKIVVPNPEQFRDVTSDSVMPQLTQDDLEAFCELTERGDIITSHNMYQESFLISCRSACKDGEYYVNAICASEMRRNVTYNIIIKCKDHIFLEAQCECAAGVGPYGQCKHILVVMFGIINFHSDKKIITKASCTNKLQTFHHPSKHYTGNPVKAEDLTLKFKDKRMKEMVKFDPRTVVEGVIKYQENFQSLVANYCGEGMKSASVPMAQMLKPADKRSLFADHDYLEKTMEQKYFDSIMLNNEEIKHLERQTKLNRKEWIKQRQLRLQSSDFGKICKQKNNKLKFAKLLLKTYNLQSPAIKHGRKYEPEAIKKFENLTGTTVSKCGIIIHPDYQFLGSTPDGLVGTSEVLEVKCPYTARNKNISSESVPYLYLCEHSGKLKLDKTHDYYYQIQGQLFCAQKNIANFFIYTISDSYHLEIERDDNFIKEMITNLNSFYNTYYKQVLLLRFLYGMKN